MNLIRIQAAHKIRFAQSQSLILSFNEASEILADLSRFLFLISDENAKNRSPPENSESTENEQIMENADKLGLGRLSLRIQGLINHLFSLHLLVKDESQKHFCSFLSNETTSSGDLESPKKGPFEFDSSEQAREEISLDRHSADLAKLKNIENKYSKVTANNSRSTEHTTKSAKFSKKSKSY